MALQFGWTHAMTVAEEIHTEQGVHTLTFDDSRQWLYIFLPRSHRAVVYEDSDATHEDSSPAAPATDK